MRSWPAWSGRAGPWGRDADSLGLALGSLRTAKGFAAASPALDGRDASGVERLAELYYRWQLAPALALSPDLQWLRRLRGDAGVRGDWVLGLRVHLTL